MKYKCVIFDLDGTLMNTSKGILEAVDIAIEKHGLPAVTTSRKEKFIGPPMKRSLMNVFGLSEEEALPIAMDFREIYSTTSLLRARTYNGMKAMLARMQKNGIKLTVATYKRETDSKILLKHFKLDKYFVGIYGSDFEGKRTKSEIVELAISASGCKKEECVVVGDSIGDGKAANELGIDFIAVTYGFGFGCPEDSFEVDPVAICRNVKELEEAL